MGTRWHVKFVGDKDGEERGPFSSTELKALADKGRIRPTDLVRKVGGEAWAKAAKVKGLFAPLPVAAPALQPVTSPPPPQPAPVSVAPTQPTSPAKKVNWFGALAGCLVLFGVGKGIVNGVSDKQPKAEGPSATVAVQQDQTKQQEVANSSGAVKISHEGYTVVVIPESLVKKTHDFDLSKGEDERNQYDQYKPRDLVSVVNIEAIDFTQGPKGEPIEMERHFYGSPDKINQTGYFYKNPSGQHVFHGPWTFYANGSKTTESIYIHGVKKTSYAKYGAFPQTVEIYRGDGQHSRMRYEHYDNNMLKSGLSYKMVHSIGSDGETINPVLHGHCVLYYDNTLVERNGLSQYTGGIMREEQFEDGNSLGFVVYTREGKARAATGVFKP